MGALLGLSEGNADGDVVGTEEGTNVGVPDGSKLGWGDGCIDRVGKDDGEGDWLGFMSHVPQVFMQTSLAGLEPPPDSVFLQILAFRLMSVIFWRNLHRLVILCPSLSILRKKVDVESSWQSVGTLLGIVEGWIVLVDDGNSEGIGNVISDG